MGVATLMAELSCASSTGAPSSSGRMCCNKPCVIRREMRMDLRRNWIGSRRRRSHNMNRNGGGGGGGGGTGSSENFSRSARNHTTIIRSSSFPTDLLLCSQQLLPINLTNNLQLLGATLLNQISGPATLLLNTAADAPAALALQLRTTGPAAIPLLFFLLTLAAPLSLRELSPVMSELLHRSKSKQAAMAKTTEILPGGGGAGAEEEAEKEKDAEETPLPLHYDPVALMDFYSKRPLLVLSRLSFVAMECSLLLANLLIDATSGGDEDKNQKLRAAQLAAMLSRLGPTAVKIGQSLSTRPDLLPPAYIEALQGLQDRVQPFSNEEAMKIIVQELGRPIEQMFSEFSAEPIAAASLGQVYRAKLRSSGKTVAVKVQRPGVRGIISLDLYVLRAIAMGLRKLPNQKSSSDFIMFLDHWAAHIFQELDYTLEAKNAETFSRNMKSLPNVVVPKALKQYTSKKVLTTSWMEGEKLSKNTDGDAAQIVSVALNCYLCQLLDSGFLHADPHPGNLLRTPDGRLCVLDFGLMLQVTEEQRYALMECISHLAHSDYDKAAGDLVNLGFVPSNPSEREQAEAMLPEASRVLGRLVRGGGMQQMDVEQILADLTGLAKDYGIVIPPYFMMILRAFSIIEGMGLRTNPNYVIIDECYPYICKQLLTDNSPRAQTIFKYFLYGQKDQLDARRVEAVFRGFQKYRAMMTSHGTDPLSREIVSSLFAPEGSFIQELLLAELVRIVDALSREAMLELYKIFVGVAPPLTPFLTALWPSTSVLGFFGINSYTLSKEDEEAIELVRRLWNLMGSEVSETALPDMKRMVTQGLTAMIPDIVAGAFTASTRFWLMLVHRKALRLADDLDGTDSLSYWNKDPAAYARHIKPRLMLPFHHETTSKRY